MSDPHRPTGSHCEKSGSDPLAFDQSRATYESLVNTLPLCLLIKDRSGHRVFANDAYLKFRGATREELLGKRDEDLFPPEIAKQFTDDDLRVMHSGQVIQDVEETLDAEGHHRWIERIKSPIFDRNHEVIGIQLLFWDVTDRVSAVRELQHERDLLSNLLRHVPDSIYFKDHESRFLRISEAMAKKFGLPNAAAALGKTDSDIFSDEHAHAAREDEIKVMQTRQPLVDRIEKETWRDREDTWCLSTKMPFLTDDGEVIGTFGISRDITELKKYQDELREARDAADRANRAKSDFLANMSHEIRTPMNAIIGMSELLAQTGLSHEQRDYVQMVCDSADSLMRLLNDILDFSKIEARKLELESIPFSMRDLIERTGRSLAMRAAEKGLELACRVAPDVPDRLVGDPGRLRQIMINLIGNAIKFTDEGEVVVDVCLGEPSQDTFQDTFQDTADGAVALRFSVSDTGIGIPEDKHASVLDAFSQADTSTTRRFGGTGLGLAITKQLVELMHGTLRLDSQVGYGTTFSFTAPFPRAPAAEEDPCKKLSQLGHLPVLVVDDNPTNRRILKEIMTTWRFEPVMAEDGKLALQALDAAAAKGKPIALAIVDYMMPEMDGFELSSRIRERYSSDQLKLILLSSAIPSEELKQRPGLDIAHYLTKPVLQSELLETILQVMGMQGQPIETIDKNVLPPCPPMRVLVAEDGIANQHVAVGLLRAGGHRAVVASDGREAIACWQSEPFDAILMDMHMPVMDGIAATEHIRAAEQATGAHVPIIALTAAAMKEDAEACKQAGMDAYLTKPIQPRMLQEVLASYAPAESSLTTIEDEEQTRATFLLTGNSTGSGERLSERLANEEPVATKETIDFRAAATRVPGGLKGVRRLAEVFIPECESLIQTLGTEIPDGDPALVQRTAHTLKGSANLFSAKNVCEHAFKIEQIAKSKQLAAAPKELALLQKEAELMLRALHHFLDITSESM